MSIEDLIRSIVREELRNLLTEQEAATEYLTARDAAGLAKVATGTIRRWMREGRLAEHRAGRVVRVKRAELEELLRNGSRRPANDLTIEEMVARDFG